MIQLRPIFENFPAELTAMGRWVLWRHERRPSGTTKVLFNPRTNRFASSTDSSTWASFTFTQRVFNRANGQYAGIGFVLGDDADFCGIDLDNCRNPATGVIDQLAMEIINSMATYAEISPSGGGVKMIGRGSMPTPDGKGKNYRKDPWKTGVGGIEMYRRGRFFTVTGHRLDQDVTVSVNEITDPLRRLYRRLYPPQPLRPRPNGLTVTSGVDRIGRCARYLAKLPPSVSGQAGHNALLKAACTCVRFDLEDADALALLTEYNSRAMPQWDDHDVERKLSEAHKVADHERGSMLFSCKTAHSPIQIRRRVVLAGGVD